MSDLEKLVGMSDEELLSWIVGRQVGDRWGDAARSVLEARNAQRMVEAITRLEAFAQRTEASSGRMEWATYVILVATLVQLGLAFWSALHGQ